MKKSARSAIVILVALIASLLTYPMYGATGVKRSDKPATPKVEKYAVVLVGAQLKIVKMSELQNIQKNTTDEDKRLIKAYEESLKHPEKNRYGVEPIKPEKRTVKILKKSLKSSDDAEDWKAEYLHNKKEDAKNNKKSADW